MARWVLRTVLVAFPVCALCALVLDAPVARWADSSSENLRRIAEIVSDLGLSGYMLGLSAVTAAASAWAARWSHIHEDKRAMLRRLAERALFVFSAVALSGIIVQVIKHVVGRARPSLIVEHGAFSFDYFSLRASHASFPSGHSTSIFTLAAALSLLMPGTGPFLFAFAAAVGAARIVLDAHYLSDILAGALLGIVTTMGVAAIFAERSIAFTRLRDGPPKHGARGFGLVVKPFRTRERP